MEKIPTAIEQYYADVNKLPVFEMSQELFELMFKLLLSPENVTILENEKYFMFKVIEKSAASMRNDSFALTDPRLIVFLSALTEVPGYAVMYLVYLKAWCITKKVPVINFDIFCKDVFPNGFPLISEMAKAYQIMKVHYEMKA